MGWTLDCVLTTCLDISINSQKLSCPYNDHENVEKRFFLRQQVIESLHLGLMIAILYSAITVVHSVFELMYTWHFSIVQVSK